MASAKECPSINANGMRCVYDAGHKGKHHAVGRLGWT